jgi:hypothetical protein
MRMTTPLGPEVTLVEASGLFALGVPGSPGEGGSANAAENRIPVHIKAATAATDIRCMTLSLALPRTLGDNPPAIDVLEMKGVLQDFATA